MAAVVPLVDIPLNAFFKTGHDHNSSMLHALRKKVKRQDGYFMYKSEHHIADTFPLIGRMYSGSWRLGRIKLTPSFNTDYQLEVYRRSLYLTGIIGTVYETNALDDHALAELLRELDTGVDISKYPSNWTVADSKTFAESGFDIV